MMKQIISVAGLAAVASAFTQPVQPPSFNSLLTPNTVTPVITGQTFDITWQPDTSAGVTVSLVLCNGPGSNCVLQNTAIVEGVSAAAGKYSWNVPCGLPEGVQSTATGYGMLIIVDGTGEFQYSTQFSVQKGASCSGSGSTTTSTYMTTSSASGPSSTGSGQWGQWPSHNTTTKAVAPSSWTVVYTSQTPAPITSAAPSTTYVQPTPAAATTSARPSSFTGAGSALSASLNVFAIIGAAGLAMFAL